MTGKESRNELLGLEPNIFERGILVADSDLGVMDGDGAGVTGVVVGAVAGITTYIGLTEMGDLLKSNLEEDSEERIAVLETRLAGNPAAITEVAETPNQDQIQASEILPGFTGVVAFITVAALSIQSIRKRAKNIRAWANLPKG